MIDAKVAIGWAGIFPGSGIERGLKKRRAKTAPQILDALPAVIRDLVEDHSRPRLLEQLPLIRRFCPVRPESELRVLVALWDEEAGEPQLWCVDSDRTVMGPRYEPYSAVRIHRYLDIAPGTESLVFGRRIVPNVDTFDPVADGLALLEHQRREPFETDCGLQYCVGGFAQLTTVNSTGVELRTLGTWPDRTRRRIDPSVAIKKNEELAWDA